MRILILFLSISFTAGSQTPVFNPVEVLSEGKIQSFTQSNSGLLWIISKHKLISFNGYENKVHLDSSELEFTAIHYSGEQEAIFIGTISGTLVKYNIHSKTVENIRLKENHPVSDILSMNEKIFIGSYGGGIYSVTDGSEYVNISGKSLKSPFVYEMIEIDSTRIAIATDRGLYFYNIQTDEYNIIENTPDVIITNLDMSPEGLLWASTFDNYIFSVHPDDFSVSLHTTPDRSKINDICVTSQGVFFSTTESLYIYDSSAGFRDVSNETSDFSRIDQLYLDSENNLWVSNETNILKRASMFFQLIDHINISHIQAILHQDNSLLVGTKDGLFLSDLSNRETIKLLDANITCLRKTNSHIAVGTYTEGIILLDSAFNQRNVINASDGIGDNTILDIFCFRQNVLCSSLAGIASVHLNEDGIIESVEKLDPQLSANYVFDIYKPNEDVTLYGKDKTGLTVYSSDTLYHLQEFRDQKIGSVYSINSFLDDIYFSSAELGILKMNRDVIEIALPNESNEDYYSSVINVRDKGFLLVRQSSVDFWMPESEKMLRFDKEMLFGNEGSFLNNYSQSKNRNYLVHNDKVYVFSGFFRDISFTPEISIDRIEMNLNEIDTDQYTFSQSENNFKFYFTGVWLSSPSKVSYEYKLEGYDNNWNKTSDKYANYLHLEPGEYTFYVKAGLEGNFNGSEVISYNFRIKRAFYNTVWFYLILLSILIGTVIFVMRRINYQKQLETKIEQSKIKAQLYNLKSQLNPHFLFNSFNTLTGLIDISSERSIRYVENLTDFYRGILSLSDKSLIPVSEELELLEKYDSILQERFNNAYVIEIHKNHDVFKLLIPPLSIQMMVENAIKHNQVSSKNPLLIKITINESYAVIENKIIPKNLKRKPSGYGIENLKQRFQILNLGEVKIIEESNIFKVKLPLRKND